MRTACAAVLVALMPAVAAAGDEMIVPVALLSEEAVPYAATFDPPALLPTDRASTLFAIRSMTATIESMAFVPRVDPVSAAVTTLTARWEVAIAGLAANWTEQTRLAITGMTSGVAKAVDTYPAGGMDFDDESLFVGPVFDGSLGSPAAGFFGP
ncbi:MAG: hypothetical protein RIR62_1015 [Pseudomonadota bacterium]